MDKTNWHRPNEEMHGKQTSCPKCELEFKTMLHPFCQHHECPVRDEPELCCDHCNATNTRDFWNRRATATPTLEDAGLLQNVRLKFTSGNSVPVERAWITRKEWDAIERILQPNSSSTP